MKEKEKNNREAIVEAARKAFAQYTLRKTTMEDIAHGANKAKSSIYYYFKSKEEIFQAVVENEIESALSEIKRAVLEQETPENKLRTYSLTRMRILHRLGTYYTILQDEYIEQYSFIDRVRRKHDQSEMAIIGDILREGVEKGTFAINNVELTSFAIVTALKGFEFVWAAENDIAVTEKSIDTLFDILFHGILKKC
jgi:AcrR family transcriptional regulator